jgi:septal ring factor EnvC (AmiA/AmiB activator)
VLAKALPIWAVRVLAAVLALAVLVLTVAVAVLLPHIPRLARAAADMPAALEVVDRAPDTLDQVERIDRNVESLTPPVAAATKDLSAVAPHIETLAGQINQLLDDLAALQRTSKPLGEAAPKIAALSGQLEGLQASLRRLDGWLAALKRDLVEPLTEVRKPLRRLADTTGPLPESLDRLNRSTAVLEQLPGYFDRLQRTLIRVARHVRNLDEKTGPNLR